MKKSIGILGIAAYLPPIVRTNDHWSTETALKWKERSAKGLERFRALLEKDPSDTARLTLEGLESVADDPFQGARERRVIPDDMKASDMETIAAREAIERAGIRADEIGLVMSHQICPDYVTLMSASVVHANLGLPQRCECVQVDASCNSFMNQLTLAQAMIESGRVKYALLTQASTLTRFKEAGNVMDAWGGDAATAAIIGEVSPGRGILSYNHNTNGQLWGTLVCGTPGRRWQDGGGQLYSEDPKSNMEWVMMLARAAREVVADSLKDAGLTHADVNFFASQQGFKWLHTATQKSTNLMHAKCVEHFHYTGATSSVNLPFQLAVGEKEGLLRPGDIVACFQGGSGMTWSGMTLRWGT